MTDSDELRTEAMIRRYRQLNAQVAELKGEMDEIKQEFQDTMPVGWQFTCDGITASKREGNRAFDVTLAIGQLTKEERELCVVTRYDADLLRSAVKEKGVLESCMAPRPNVEPVVKLS